MGAKRAVQGRSRPYDELLLEWNRLHNPNWVEPVKRESKAERKERKEREKPKMAKTDDAAQAVFKAEETGHPKTPVAGESASETASAAEATPSAEKREEAVVVEEEAPVAEEVPAASSSEPAAAAEATATRDAEKPAGHATDEL